MGARPLQRVIDKDLKRNLAKMMLFGELKNGGWATITVDGDQLMIVAKSKEPKLPLLTVEATENVV
jgi:ATP-dependent Clp protease ATP-binding subunit ClpA